MLITSARNKSFRNKRRQLRHHRHRRNSQLVRFVRLGHPENCRSCCLTNKTKQILIHNPPSHSTDLLRNVPFFCGNIREFIDYYSAQFQLNFQTRRYEIRFTLSRSCRNMFYRFFWRARSVCVWEIPNWRKQSPVTELHRETRSASCTCVVKVKMNDASNGLHKGSLRKFRRIFDGFPESRLENKSAYRSIG